MADKQRVLIFNDHYLKSLATFVHGRFEPVGIGGGADRLDSIAAVGAGIRIAIANGNDRIDKAVLDRLPDLEHIQILGAGMDGTDLAELDRRGIAIANASSVHAAECADFAVTLMLTAWRDVVAADRSVRNGDFERNGWRIWGRSLQGVKVGIAGLGYIGEAIARRVEPFCPDIGWWGPRPKPHLPWRRHDGLLDLARDVDILFVVVKAHDDTRGLISREIIEAVGPKGLLVNISRGFVIDEDALIAALSDGRLGLAALDVFETEPTPAARWKDVPNTLLTPHIAGGTPSSLGRLGAYTVDKVCEYLGV